MIVLSLILVIVAAVTLLAGFFSDGLTLIWISIASCVLSIVTLALGVMQRRREAPELAPPGAYVPGTPGPRPAPAQLATVSEGTDTATEVIAKTSARDAAERRADVEAAGAAAADEIVAPVKSATRKKATRKKATRKAAKKTAKKATKKAAKKATKKSAKKAAKKATGRTTGAAARARLGAIKGVGPAKQDALLKKFKSLEAIRDASIEELSSVDGVGPTAAKTIKDALA
ncbi:MAG: helix-hairpin-helix domain-containing protein [Nitriliruptorales bacterium]|nr:helix-hairpin-helix domain-containing protein [Nitriliruptorales bacterium]